MCLAGYWKGHGSYGRDQSSIESLGPWIAMNLVLACANYPLGWAAQEGHGM